MAAKKKKPATKRTIQASDVIVDNRRLDAVLADLAEVMKECAVRSARAEERSAKAEEGSRLALQAIGKAEEGVRLALQTIGSVLQDLRALAEQTDNRLLALEKAAAE